MSVLRFILLGIGIGIGAFGVLFLALLPVMVLQTDQDPGALARAQTRNSWAPFTSTLGMGGRRAGISADSLVLPHWVAVPNGAFAVRKTTTAIHRGGPGSVTLSFSIEDPSEILQEFYETLFLAKGFAVEDRLKPSDPMFNIVVNLFAVDRNTDRSAKLVIRDQLGRRSARLTFTTNGDMRRKGKAIASRSSAK